MVGLGKVISYINQNERMKLSGKYIRIISFSHSYTGSNFPVVYLISKYVGLYMIPNLADYDSGIFLYNLPDKDIRFKTIADAYINEIDTYLSSLLFKQINFLRLLISLINHYTFKNTTTSPTILNTPIAKRAKFLEKTNCAGSICKL